MYQLSTTPRQRLARRTLHRRAALGGVAQLRNDVPGILLAGGARVNAAQGTSDDISRRGVENID